MEVSAEIGLQRIQLLADGFGQSVAELRIEFFDQRDLILPQIVIHGQDLLKGLSGDFVFDAGQVDIVCVRNVTDRGLLSVDLTVTAIQDPVQNTQVVAEAGPQEVALVVLAEPVDVEDLGGLIGIE